MREILFKAKRLDNGEWVCGANFFRAEHTKTKSEVVFLANTGSHCNGNLDDCGNIDNIFNCSYFAVDPLTIGQFTGLTDKNGKKIFEGDLVRNGYSSNLGEFWDIGNVVYVPTDGCFEISNLCERYLKRLTQTQIIKRSIEVIGTIHDKAVNI